VRTSLFWVFVLAFCWIQLISGFFAIGEYNVGYAVVAAAGAILLLPQITAVDGIVLLLVAILATRSYELMAFAGPLLALSCVGRLRVDGAGMEVTARWMTGLSAALFAVGAASAVGWIINPRDPVQYASAVSGLPLLFSRPILYTSALSALALLASLKHRPRWSGGAAGMLRTGPRCALCNP
jgi:hypothetical protein